MNIDTARITLECALRAHAPEEDLGSILQALDHGDPALSEWGRTRGIAVAAVALYVDGICGQEAAHMLGDLSEVGRVKPDPEDEHAEVSGGDFIDWLNSTHPTLWVRLRSAFLHRGNER